VSAVAHAGLPVEVVPGPSALDAALAVSGLPASQFRFAGFLPRRGGERSRVLEMIARDPATTVIYEAPGRVQATVVDLVAACGEARPFVAARELTKVHEEVWRGTLGDAVSWLEEAQAPRGEWVLLVGGASGRDLPEVSDEEIAADLRARIAAGEGAREAVATVAARMAVPKRRVYDLAVSVRKGVDPGPGTARAEA
jgi:16S rRNA (cytidine1402-2'-O)-methyltransferase